MGNGASPRAFGSPEHQSPTGAVLAGIAEVVGASLGAKQKPLVRKYSRASRSEWNTTSSKAGRTDWNAVAKNLTSSTTAEKPQDAAAPNGPRSGHQRHRRSTDVADPTVMGKVRWEAAAGGLAEKVKQKEQKKLEEKVNYTRRMATEWSNVLTDVDVKAKPVTASLKRSNSATELNLESISDGIPSGDDDDDEDDDDDDEDDEEDTTQDAESDEDDDEDGSKAFSKFFQTLDVDGNGVLDLAEFIEMIRQHSWAANVQDSVLERVFNALDVDNDGAVSEDEFRAWFADFSAARMQKKRVARIKRSMPRRSETQRLT